MTYERVTDDLLHVNKENMLAYACINSTHKEYKIYYLKYRSFQANKIMSDI